MARRAVSLSPNELVQCLYSSVNSYICAPVSAPFYPFLIRVHRCRHADDREGLYFYIVPQSDALGVFFYSIVMHYI